MKDKALARLKEVDMRMGRYYPPNDSLMPFLHEKKLCVEAIGLILRRTRGGLLYSGATKHRGAGPGSPIGYASRTLWGLIYPKLFENGKRCLT
jgi:hypothetical protein